jgi:tetratricopeptide (TPR) repeat protein
VLRSWGCQPIRTGLRRPGFPSLAWRAVSVGRHRPTPLAPNVEGYELYLKGRALVGRRGVPSLKKAADLFQQAIAKDSAFAPAHAGLAIADAHVSVPSGSPIPFETAQSIIRTAATKALELDPLLADAHTAMGWLRSRELDWSSAEKAFQRAIDLNPSLTQTYTSYSTSTLRPLGKLDDALRLLRVALENDPLSLDVQREIGEVQIQSGRYEEAINTLQRVRAVDPDLPFADDHLARALIFSGRPAEALPVPVHRWRCLSPQSINGL